MSMMIIVVTCVAKLMRKPAAMIFKMIYRRVRDETGRQFRMAENRCAGSRKDAPADVPRGSPLVAV